MAGDEDGYRIVVPRRWRRWLSYASARGGYNSGMDFSLARRMGTSVEMIDRTYGHLAPDAEDYERGLLEAYDSREIAPEEEAR